MSWEDNALEGAEHRYDYSPEGQFVDDDGEPVDSIYELYLEQFVD